LKPYEKNAKKHPAEQVEHIANSIREFGFRQPLVIDKDNVLVIGHGRLLAAKKLGLDTVPCVRADDLTDEQIKALRLADNKTNESEWDFDLLGDELDDILKIDMSMFGFDAETEDNENEGEYTKKTDIPQYDVHGDNVSLEQLVDREKALALIEEIEGSNVSEEEKTFLKLAARRHYVFNYKKIAEYYASASEEMQELMERSALVIIDYNNAIANGYIKLSKKLEELRIGDA
jgi:hypothetical protein